MLLNHGSHIRRTVLDNLLTAHKRIAEAGTAKEIILLSKFILKLSKQFDKELLDFGAVERGGGADSPPNDGEDNIA